MMTGVLLLVGFGEGEIVNVVTLRGLMMMLNLIKVSFQSQEI